MFELSDDDDEFWEDLPLLDVTKQTESKKDVGFESKRLCLEKENIQSVKERFSESVNKELKTHPVSLPTPVLSTNSADTNLHQSAHGNRITCGFFTPVKSPDNGSKPSKAGVELNDRLSSKTELDANHNGSHPQRGITYLQSRTPNISRNDTHVESRTPNMAWSKTPGNILSPGTPSAAKNPSVPRELPLPGRRGKRKFPGPAGRLPKLKPGEVMNKSTTVSPESEKKGTEDVILCSQMNDDVFNESSWKTLKQDLGPDAEVILDQFSVSASLSMASKKTLPHGKIPLLFVIVESLDLQGAGGSVVLKDKTGRIKGTLHRDVIKEYGAEIQPGTTLVLRQVGVVSPTHRTHYLNITPTNMVYLNSNTSNLNKHLFHHHSLKHFMADFKRKRKQQQLGEDNSVRNGNLIPSTAQRCSNRIISSGNSSTAEHTPRSAGQGVRSITPNSSSCGTGITSPRPTLNSYQRATTPNSVNRLSESFGGNANQRVTTPNSVSNSRLAAPNRISHVPVGNITPRPTLNGNQRAITPIFSFNQRDTTPDCGSGVKITNTAVSSRLSFSNHHTQENLANAGVVPQSSSVHNLEVNQNTNSNTSQQGTGAINSDNGKRSSSENSNIAKFPKSSFRTQNPILENSVNLMHGTHMNSNLTEVGNFNKPKALRGNSEELIRTNCGQTSSSRIVPTFGKSKTNQNTPLASKMTLTFPQSTQNNVNFSKTSSRTGNDSVVVTPKTSKFTFKSKTPCVSPGVQSVVPSCQVPSVPSEQTDLVDCDSLWQDDDISDEMLTHLTEDMP